MFEIGDRLVAIGNVKSDMLHVEIIEKNEYYYGLKFSDGIKVSKMSRGKIDIAYRKA
ncbi:hypothetical protein [Brochothrix thermosphacta]|uniref:hypothetical protein n=1 Tax=Brochothrix thermosphacta TaxID=2756 RepID=UPI003F9A3C75